jgi:hypothetical protein
MPDPPISFLNNIVYLPVEAAADVLLCSSSIAHNLMTITLFKLDIFYSEGVGRASRVVHAFFTFLAFLLS